MSYPVPQPVILPGIKAKAVVVDMGEAAEAPQPLWRRTLRGMTSLLGMDSSRAGAGGVDTGKRKLIRDNRDTLMLTVPFLIWGAVVIAIYTFSYLTLKKVRSCECAGHVCGVVWTTGWGKMRYSEIGFGEVKIIAP